METKNQQVDYLFKITKPDEKESFNIIQKLSTNYTAEITCVFNNEEKMNQRTINPYLHYKNEMYDQIAEIHMDMQSADYIVISGNSPEITDF